MCEGLRFETQSKHGIQIFNSSWIIRINTWFPLLMTDPVNVMSAFKTFPCSGKSRITSSGYCDCTGYHGKKDRRRSFKYYKYFSAPCMYVKVGDEWKEPTLCPYNDGCFNCHTRFEQQFHPEVFKKMKVS